MDGRIRDCSLGPAGKVGSTGSTECQIAPGLAWRRVAGRATARIDQWNPILLYTGCNRRVGSRKRNGTRSGRNSRLKRIQCLQTTWTSISRDAARTSCWGPKRGQNGGGYIISGSSVHTYQVKTRASVARRIPHAPGSPTRGGNALQSQYRPQISYSSWVPLNSKSTGTMSWNPSWALGSLNRDENPVKASLGRPCRASGLSYIGLLAVRPRA